MPIRREGRRWTAASTQRGPPPGGPIIQEGLLGPPRAAKARRLGLCQGAAIFAGPPERIRERAPAACPLPYGARTANGRVLRPYASPRRHRDPVASGRFRGPSDDPATLKASACGLQSQGFTHNSLPAYRRSLALETVLPCGHSVDTEIDVLQ